MADGIELNVDQVMSQLDLTQNKLNTGVNKVLKESGEILKDEIKRNTNRSSGGTHRYGEGHAQDDVIVSNVKGGRTDEKYIETGYNRTAWRMYFVEFGTVYQKPQSIVQKSIKNKESEVLTKQAEGLRGVLGT